MSLAEIQNSVAALNEKEKGVLAAWLLASLPSHTSEDAIRESIAEGERRSGELNAGQVPALSSDEFWASVQKLKNSWR